MKFEDINGLLHGGDYNAEQWLDRPDILAEDIRLMKKAGVNVVTLGVFSWSMYEPQEGEFHFEWLDKIMDDMYSNGIYVILATPSAGKPPWLIKKYPDIMRTRADRTRLLYGERENHCNSNIVFRAKVYKIDSLLAEHYHNHPALIMWHISNEVYGECHCEDCQNNFRKWLKNKYGTIDNLNKEYWSGFWSHRYNDFSEIESPSPHGETAVHALMLDYKRFYSDLSIDFIQSEINAVKKYNPDIPVTTNIFHFNCGINLARLSEFIDVVSWDSYPHWHCENDWDTAVKAAFGFDFCRSQKNKPFLLMESTPSTTNSFENCKLKKPGVHILSSVQAVACGSNSVQYFQWRKSRGAYEKFHGAVLSHNGSENTRVFREVAEVGKRLEELQYIKDTNTESSIALIYDWENMRALEEQKSLHSKEKPFDDTIMEHYEALCKNYVSADIIDTKTDFSQYDLIIAPMLYMTSEDTVKKIRGFVQNGGAFVMSFYSGLVNENDLAYECWPPYSLNDVFGIRVEETDALCINEYNEFIYNGKSYKALYACDLIHADTAEVFSRYQSDFYKGMPAVTANNFGLGVGYYIACRTNKDFIYDFYKDIITKRGIRKIVNSEYVDGVMVKERSKDNKSYKFLMNFADSERKINNTELNGYEVEIISE
ncbi:MAG: beta-galactosidase [Clostridia bacterium]|nr:beta-galactosidase [Clostridia bacterium]MCI9085628.1 beta-galactosidase [Clostridia bacterium]